MRDVALVPQRHVFHGRHRRGPYDAGKTRQVFGQYGIALVGHGGRAFLALREEFFRLPHFRPLQVADFGRDAFHRTGDHAQDGEEHGVPIARDDLGRYRLERQAEPLRDVFFHSRIDVGERAHRPGNGTGGDFLARSFQTLTAALEFGIGLGEFQAKGRGFGMDAVAAAHANGVLVLHRPGFKRRQHAVHIGQQDIGGAAELNGQACIQNVGRSHTLVDEARRLADVLRHVGEEGNDVVLGFPFDFIDPFNLEGALVADGGHGVLRDDAQLRLCLASIGLDVEPDLKFGFGFPDGNHLGTGVTRDHLGLKAILKRMGEL